MLQPVHVYLFCAYVKKTTYNVGIWFIACALSITSFDAVAQGFPKPPKTIFQGNNNVQKNTNTVVTPDGTTSNVTSNSDDVEIINSNQLRYKNTDYEVQILTGNVQIRHEGTYLECDSAYVFRGTKRVDAYGHVYINNNGKTDIYCDTGYYFGDRKLSVLKGHAILNDGKMKLSSPELIYDLNTEIGVYNSGGVVNSDETEIKSKKGTYYNASSDVYFKDDVFVKHPQFKLESDTLQYNTKTDIATFYSNTIIKGEGSTVYCRSGHYDTRKGLADFGPQTKIVNESQTLFSDSIYYDRNIGFAKTYYYYLMQDDSNKICIIGTRANYKEETKYLFAYERPLMISYAEPDTLFLKADTLISFNKEDSDKRFFYAYRNVRLYKKDLQARADSLYYSYEDSTFRMYYKPVLWSKNMQSSADTIYIYTKSQKPDVLKYYTNAFIIMETRKNYYDQIKGNFIQAFLKNNAIETMDVKGSAESIYYGKNDLNRLIGMNHAQCTSMKLLFKESEIDVVKFYTKPTATFTPIRKVSDDMKQLKNFIWQTTLRPSSKLDL